MRLITIIVCAFAVTACLSHAKYQNESMYDMASMVKDIAQSVDGELKFGETTGLSKQQVVQNAVQSEQLTRLSQLAKAANVKNYRIIYQFQGQNAVTLICDGDTALMEDAGCNAIFDNTYWHAPKSGTCQFSINASEICEQ